MRKTIILFFVTFCITSLSCSCKKELLSPDSPSILTVLTPNGGELYSAGQLITVRWGTTHAPPGHYVIAQLINTSASNIVTSVILYPEYSVPTSVGLATFNDGTERYRIPWQHRDDGMELYANGITTKTFTIRLTLGLIDGDGIWNAQEVPVEGVSKSSFTIQPSSLPDGCTTNTGYSETTGQPCFQ